VEFEAHRKVKREKEVKFTTNSGKRIDFQGEKIVKEPVRVKFTAKKKK
jgi:hypothetical protein